MFAWRFLWNAEALFLMLLVGCSGIPQVPRVQDNGPARAVVHIPRAAGLQSVTLEQEEFQQAIRRLAREVRMTGTPRQTVEKMFQMDPQFGNYLWLEKDQKLVPLGPGEPLEGTLTQEDLETAERYRLWCQRVHNLVNGWSQLMDEVKVATTFEQIRDAGERFGKIIGRQAARAFAMLLMAAIGSTAQQFAAKVPTLPGSAQVAVQAEGTAGIRVAALGKVEQIALSAEGVSVTVAATAMTMGASGSGSSAPCIEKHHIATVCNDKDTKRGGPWTPRFREIFAKAGMSMEDPANKMPLPGHYGPHPEGYHRIIHKELLEATAACRSVVDCRAALTARLRKLAKLIATPGTELNQLVTRQ